MLKRWMTKDMMVLMGAQLLFGMIGALLIHLLLLPKTPLTIATVNITGLEDSFIHETTQQHLTQAAMNQKVTTFANTLNKTVIEMAKQKHVILIPSEAVIAGSPDMTRDVADKVKKGLKS